ncbi:MAG: alpha/beta hydrolase fold domain-containing protein [Planctomycetes bacterium]|nr:alpha/beta hydrolase fold domain-containing protein [Planctomycetota bacterium]
MRHAPVRIGGFDSVVLAVVCALAMTSAARAEEQINLWPDNSAELVGVDAKHVPTLHLFPGPTVEGKKPVVLICPAGGYKAHSDSHRQVEWLNSLRIAAYVVMYRLPGDGYKHPAPLHDAQRAMRIIRQNADAWHLDVRRIGVLGGSSGGHVATTLATHYDSGNLPGQNRFHNHSLFVAQENDVKHELSADWAIRGDGSKVRDSAEASDRNRFQSSSAL